MEDTSSPRRAEASLPPTRKAWAEPAIVLERSLEAAAEGTPPQTGAGAHADQRVPRAARRITPFGWL